jgi:hypothetical protein
MDERQQQLDAITRQFCAARDRRAMLGALVALALGGVTSVLSPAQPAAARRDACMVRCGGEMRLCRGQCQIKAGPSEKQCKKTCKAWRDQCFGQCDFKSLRRRTVPMDRGDVDSHRRAQLSGTRDASGVMRRP